MSDAELIRFTPEQLTQRCGCSPRHFSRLFRQQFGLSVRARHTELRMLKARQLLEDLNLPVAKVATESGYHNLSLFNSQF